MFTIIRVCASECMGFLRWALFSGAFEKLPGLLGGRFHVYICQPGGPLHFRVDRFNVGLGELGAN